MLEARRQEKNFILRGFTVMTGDTQNAVEKMQAILAQAEAQLAKTTAEVDHTEEQELLAAVGGDLNDYKDRGVPSAGLSISSLSTSSH